MQEQLKILKAISASAIIKISSCEKSNRPVANRNISEAIATKLVGMDQVLKNC